MAGLLDAVADHFLISSESAAGSMHQNHSFFRAAAELWQEALGAALLEWSVLECLTQYGRTDAARPFPEH